MCRRVFAVRGGDTGYGFSMTGYSDGAGLDLNKDGYPEYISCGSLCFRKVKYSQNLRKCDKCRWNLQPDEDRLKLVALMPAKMLRIYYERERFNHSFGEFVSGPHIFKISGTKVVQGGTGGTPWHICTTSKRSSQIKYFETVQTFTAYFQLMYNNPSRNVINRVLGNFI
jgi:hypothetical protein